MDLPSFQYDLLIFSLGRYVSKRSGYTSLVFTQEKKLRSRNVVERLTSATTSYMKCSMTFPWSQISTRSDFSVQLQVNVQHEVLCLSRQHFQHSFGLHGTHKLPISNINLFSLVRLRSDQMRLTQRPQVLSQRPDLCPCYHLCLRRRFMVLYWPIMWRF